jgi:prepilin-type N-terminal cleavage/methylation domain-containing protein
MRTISSNNKGFTLIELLIVIFILGVLASVIIPNFSSFVISRHAIKEAGNYTIYTQQGGVKNEIGTINLGELLIQYPGSMSINESDLITVSVTSMSNEPIITTLSGDSTQKSNNYVMVPNQIPLYPVMSAELQAANFDIGEQINGMKAVSNDGAVWKWDVSPKYTGDQQINIEIDVPIQVQGFEPTATQAIFTQQLTIKVSRPFNWRTLLEGLSLILGIIFCLISIRDKIIKIWKQRKNKKRTRAADGKEKKTD